MTFEEVYQRKLNFELGLQEINKLELDVIDNSEFEIKKAIESFYDLMNNNLNLDEIVNKQKKYWQTVEKYFGFKNSDKVIICPDFYLNNIDLFK